MSARNTILTNWQVALPVNSTVKGQTLATHHTRTRLLSGTIPDPDGPMVSSLIKRLYRFSRPSVSPCRLRLRSKKGHFEAMGPRALVEHKDVQHKLIARHEVPRPRPRAILKPEAHDNALALRRNRRERYQSEGCRDDDRETAPLRDSSTAVPGTRTAPDVARGTCVRGVTGKVGLLQYTGYAGAVGGGVVPCRPKMLHPFLPWVASC